MYTFAPKTGCTARKDGILYYLLRSLKTNAITSRWCHGNHGRLADWDGEQGTKSQTSGKRKWWTGEEQKQTSKTAQIGSKKIEFQLELEKKWFEILHATQTCHFHSTSPTFWCFQKFIKMHIAVHNQDQWRRNSCRGMSPNRFPD